MKDRRKEGSHLRKDGRKEHGARKEGRNMYKCILKKGGKKKHGSLKEGRMQGSKERGREGRK